MAYSTTNPPKCILSGFGGSPSIWGYNSTDVHTDVDATEYFTDGKQLGMKVGDYVMVGKTTATIGATLHYVQTVATAGVTISPAILA
ncbi:MAG: hypothetical protein E5X81_20905 [Mesorhizobium sp.]|nr:MAG: hypothetical protein E5X81_20905 [Mesorhizobium sp.]